MPAKRVCQRRSPTLFDRLLVSSNPKWNAIHQLYMTGSGPDAGANRVVKRGETYTHDEYGQVKVEGIWMGVNQVDEAGHSDEQDLYVVRFSTESTEMRTDEITNTLGQFLSMTE